MAAGGGMGVVVKIDVDVALGAAQRPIVARIFREVRPFRIYDGPSEVHRCSIAQRVLRQGSAGPA